MNFLLIATRNHQEYVQQYSNGEVIEIYGRSGFDALKDGGMIVTAQGDRVIDMTIAARAAMAKPDAYRELLS